ncbi:hypothetical protein MYAM1_004011 [Malassezia yamatoensis]|uniref:Dynactin subunit 4 n=1 Tax=Malassezia yamatoensis TaxID=253288 RepID=A0AAJ6CJX1_9BASI|nr:hypothetical protein MYAM1_004011 [Malassezia yamatoensis]
MNEAKSSQRTFDDIAQHLARYVSIPTTSSMQTSSVPRVLADLPSLPTRYWQGTKRTIPPVERPDHLPAYTMQPNRMQSKQISREARRASRFAQQTTLNGIDPVSSRQQRSKMPLSEPYEANALRPHRVRLVAKIGKKCPECQRWLICPELRVSSSRFKLRRLAKNYLPQILSSHSDSHEKWLLTFSNPLQDTVNICLRSHHAEFSIDQLHLQAASEYRNFAPDSAQGDVSSESCAQVDMHRYTDPDTPTLLQVDWNVAHRQQTLWVWVSSAFEIE